MRNFLLGLLGLLALTHAAQAQVSCDVLTEAQLLAAFSDNAPAGSITPYNVRNVICSIYAGTGPASVLLESGTESEKISAMPGYGGAATASVPIAPFVLAGANYQVSIARFLTLPNAATSSGAAGPSLFLTPGNGDGAGNGGSIFANLGTSTGGSPGLFEINNGPLQVDNNATVTGTMMVDGAMTVDGVLTVNNNIIGDGVTAEGLLTGNGGEVLSGGLTLQNANQSIIGTTGLTIGTAQGAGASTSAGQLNIISGSAGGTGVINGEGGEINIVAGSSNQWNGSNVVIQGGSTSGSFPGGNVVLEGGTGGSAPGVVEFYAIPTSDPDIAYGIYENASGALTVSGKAGPGTGSVASVGLALPSIFTVSGSPVTGSGTLTGALATQSANTVFAGPGSGAAAAPTFRALVGADLPNPSATTKGGVESLASATNEFLTSISTSGAPTQAQPSFSNLSGVATAAQLPAATSSALGGVIVGSNISLSSGTISLTGANVEAALGFTPISGNQTITLSGAVTGSGTTAITTTLGTQGANTLLANVSGSTASPTAASLPSCSATGSALQYTSGTGLSCALLGAIGAGTSGQVAVYNGANVLSGSSGFLYSGGLITLGNLAGSAGTITLEDGSTASVSIKAGGVTSPAYVFRLPTTAGAAGQPLLSAGGATAMTWGNATLSGTTASIGGSALLAGACSSGTVAITGAATTMAVIATPATFPGTGSYWYGYVSAAGTVTVSVCATIALTTTASVYNVRIIQ